MYDHPVRKVVVEGIVFTEEILQSTGAEMSFMNVPPHTVMPFLHAHKKHEEIYVICIQTMSASIDCYLGYDGFKGEGEPSWQNK